MSVDAAQTQITSVGTLTSLTVDDITLDGSTISDSGDFTIDAGGDIILDTGGDDIKLKLVVLILVLSIILIAIYI